MSTLVYPSRLSIFEGTTPPRSRSVSGNVFDVLSKWVNVLPTPNPSPEGRRLALDIQRATGWSDRAMARALGTSHPTIGKLLDGQPVNSALAQKIVRAHEVISRIHVISGGDVQATTRALETSIQGEDAATALLAQGAYAKAYLRAIDVLRPRQTGMLVGSRPARSGRGNIPFLDEE